LDGFVAETKITNSNMKIRFMGSLLYTFWLKHVYLPGSQLSASKFNM